MATGPHGTAESSTSDSNTASSTETTLHIVLRLNSYNSFWAVLSLQHKVLQTTHLRHGEIDKKIPPRDSTRLGELLPVTSRQMSFCPSGICDEGGTPHLLEMNSPQALNTKQNFETRAHDLSNF